MRPRRAPRLRVPEGIAGATGEYLARPLRVGTWPQRPARDAASLVILDDSDGEPRFLMGRRASGHVFLPGVLVFPGGRVEPQDYRIRPGYDFPGAAVAKLAARSRTRHPAAFARALAAAALREAREEVGFLSPACRPERGADLRQLSFVLRALTPAKRPRRFDTRFFCLRCRGAAAILRPGDGELEDVSWYALGALAKEDLHVVSRAVIETLMDRLNTGRLDDPQAPVPFLFARGSGFQRVVL
ncbi:NUDIX domain-containing protein [Dichotomicrobium thermohalophilum]|uniref:NUDIX domain-containing protein n=1 Tax=Dichotomicrobium thermohalophilum TaxID=933063 RepID=A0A397PKE6_9HYPH|nr:NUDIX domain-containing protein [Dichotomicrobium thermohalophilum]RIA47765.1 NUDIX domain-containing protein [Dichotomicrobium thermohalophilum]